MGNKAPTFDEQGYITRGLGYLRGENRQMRIGHPLGLNALSAVFLVRDPTVSLPVDDPSWALTSFHRPSELFLWEIGNDVEHVMFLARLPMVWLGLLMAAIAGRWAWELTGKRSAGLLALAILALDPNILAHTRLTTTDLGLAAGATLAGFFLWRFLRQPGWGRAIVAGITFGLLQNTKFTAGLFVPLFGLVILLALLLRWRTDGRFPWPLLTQLLVAYPLAAFMTLWASYGFEIGTLPDSLPIFSQLGGRTLPLAHHLEQLLDIGGRLLKSTPAFLLGRYSDQGWWYYFPVTFLLKTPLPTLALLAWAGLRAVMLVSRRVPAQRTEDGSGIPFWDLASLLILPGGYLAIALTSGINLGYRHLLPMLPFLAVFIAALVPHFPTRPFLTSMITPVLVGALALSTLSIFPHFLAYFNALAGGPENGWRALVDSNLDWGQDLSGLADWADERDLEPLWLSYFGEARPDYYGLPFRGLPSFPPRLMNPDAQPFYPADPAPGIYAISATNLQGVLFQDHDLFAWFRGQEPMEKIGYTIFIYDVPPHGRPAALALGELQLDELAPADFALLGTNDVTPSWFDPTQSLLLPAGERRWLALGEELDPLLNPIIIDHLDLATAGSAYALYQVRPELTGLPGGQDELTLFSQGAGQIALVDYDLRQESVAPGGSVELITFWEQGADPAPLKIFIHVLGPDSDSVILAQWDGLGAVWQGWRPGGLLVQVHRFALPADIPAGRLQLWAGLYHPDSLTRWQTESGDRVFLGEVLVR